MGLQGTKIKYDSVDQGDQLDKPDLVFVYYCSF